MSDERDFFGIGVASRLLGLSKDYIRDHHRDLELIEHRTGGQHRRYRLREVKIAALCIAAEKQREAVELRELWAED